MNYNNRTHNAQNNDMDHTDIAKASYHGSSSNLDASFNSSSNAILDGPKKIAVISVVKSLSTFDQEQMAAGVIRKRSKPRRQSGVETENITEEGFKKEIHRPFLRRDDSVFLLKQKTTNAIATIVPLAGEGDSAEAPLARIQRQRQHRSKPRRMSGDAVAMETRPVMLLERSDSLQLAKRKLMAGYGAFDMDASNQSQSQQSSQMSDSQSTLMDASAKSEAVVEEEAEEEDMKPAAKTTPTANGKAAPARLNRKPKMRGVVRQNSFGPPCA